VERSFGSTVRSSVASHQDRADERSPVLLHLDKEGLESSRFETGIRIE